MSRWSTIQSVGQFHGNPRYSVARKTNRIGGCAMSDDTDLRTSGRSRRRKPTPIDPATADRLLFMRNKQRPKTDYCGKRFSRLTVIRYVPGSKWVCQCDCGKTNVVSTASLTGGTTKSCGCHRRDLTIKRNTTHGYADRIGRRSKIYQAWSQMHDRCRNPNNNRYHLYGARGISVCERWKDFANFYADMGEPPSPQHSIGRIRNNENYTPGNCRWETAKQQANNTRRNRILTVNGVSKTLSQWSEAVNIKTNTIWMRLNYYGWSQEKAVTTPLR